MTDRTNLGQWIKWIVYLLLLVNWAFYIQDDWRIAEHTLRNGGSILDWSGAFATSIDELAWFALLGLSLNFAWRWLISRRRSPGMNHYGSWDLSPSKRIWLIGDMK